MTIVTGFIADNGIIVTADTLLVNLQDRNNSIDGFQKIWRFHIDNNDYLIGCAGLLDNVISFKNILMKHEFTNETINTDTFANELKTILASQQLSNLTLLVGGVTDKKIFRIKFNYIDAIDKKNQYFVLLPDSVADNTELKEFWVTPPASNSILDLLNKFHQKVFELDDSRVVNDDFFYTILLDNGKIDFPTQSKNGFNMI